MINSNRIDACAEDARQRVTVLGVGIDAISWPDAIDRITRWAAARESRYVCFCNVHSVVTATRDPRYREIIEQADLATPDGMPVVWLLRWLACPQQERIDGPDLMWRYLAEAERLQQAVFFYGTTDEVLQRLRARALRAFPGLRIAGMHAPPFRQRSEQELAADAEVIIRSGAQVVLVGLGCPKQEQWMASQRGRVNAVMLGVGAAFNYHAGVIKRAPPWMRGCGLEWLHRLMSEPQRLGKRYLVTNALFIIGLLRQAVSRRR